MITTAKQAVPGAPVSRLWFTSMSGSWSRDVDEAMARDEVRESCQRKQWFGAAEKHVETSRNGKNYRLL